MMKEAGYLTSLKYSQWYTDWKEETQRTISTQKLCRIYTKHLKKIHCTVAYFEGTVRDDFATVDLES